VERDARGLVASCLPLRPGREELADGREYSAIGRGFRAWRAADRALVDLDHLVEVLDALQRVVCARFLACPVQLLCQLLVERVGDQGTLARARDAGDANELAERELDGHVLQVVLTRPREDQRLAIPFTSLFRDRNLPPPTEEVAGD